MSVCTGAQPPTWRSSLSKDSNRHSIEAPQELQQPPHHVPVPSTKADFHCPARSNLGPEGSHNWRGAEPGETRALSAGHPLQQGEPEPPRTGEAEGAGVASGPSQRLSSPFFAPRSLYSIRTAP